MLVRIQVLKKCSEVRELLCEDGWDVDEEGAGALVATHPRAGDQPAARARLRRLGLLTSARLRIEFDHKRLATRGRGRILHGFPTLA
jgi:hypothetical protein